MLSSDLRAVYESYQNIYEEGDGISCEMIEEIVEELIEEYLEFGHNIDEAADVVEQAALQYLMELNPYAAAGSKEARAYAKSTTATKRGEARKTAVKAAKEKVKAKVKGAAAAASIGASIAKDEARRAGRKAAHAVSSTVQKKKAEVKKGVKGLIGRGLSAIAGGAGKVAQKAAGAASRLGEEYVDEAITSEKGKAKAAEMIAKRTTASGRAKPGQGDTVSQIRHISRANVDGYGGTPPNRKVAKNPVKSNFTGLKGGTGNKAARRAGLTPTREKPNAWKEEVEFDIWDVVLEYLITNGHADTNEEALYVMSQLDEEAIQSIIEAQHARENPEKYEREQRSKETRGQSAERRVRDRLSTMDPEKAAKMKAQMRAVGLNV